MSHYAVQDSFELATLLPQSPSCRSWGGGASPSHLVFVDCVFFVVSVDVGKTKMEGLLSTGTLATVDAVAFLSLFP